MSNNILETLIRRYAIGPQEPDIDLDDIPQLASIIEETLNNFDIFIGDVYCDRFGYLLSMDLETPEEKAYTLPGMAGLELDICKFCDSLDLLDKKAFPYASVAADGIRNILAGRSDVLEKGKDDSSSKKEEKESVLEQMKDLLDNNLSHGSGINDKWHYKRHKENYECDNVYEHMNENGFYDRAISFSVKIPDKDPMAFKIIIHGSSSDRKFAEKDELKPYLEDLIADSITPISDEYKKLANSLSRSKTGQGR